MLTWAIVALIKAFLKSNNTGEVEMGCTLALAIVGDVVIALAIITLLSVKIGCAG